MLHFRKHVISLEHIRLKKYSQCIDKHFCFISRRNSTTNLRERKGQTLTYDPKTEYQFDQSRSCSGCDPMKDRFTTVNYPLLVSIADKNKPLKN